MPGYTHLQRAQPVYLSHHLLAYFWMLERDRGALRLRGGRRREPAAARRGRARRRQLRDRPRSGRGASSASTRVAENSIDAVSNRDFVLDYLAAAATCATHLSRLGAEIVLWSSEEFGFCEVADAWASGSSIMPQKKNPDAAELLRAKAPRVAGHLVALHGVLHGAPADLQQGHAGGQGAPVRRGRHARAVPRGGARDARRRSSFDRERLAAAASDELLAATDVADLLVRHGRAVPRGARRRRRARPRGARAAAGTLSELEPERAAGGAPGARRGVYRGPGRGRWLESKVSEGGTALAAGARAARAGPRALAARERAAAPARAVPSTTLPRRSTARSSTSRATSSGCDRRPRRARPA